MEGLRPEALDVPAAAVRELLKPAVTEATDYIYANLPPQVKYARVNHPMAIVSLKLDGSGPKRL